MRSQPRTFAVTLKDAFSQCSSARLALDGVRLSGRSFVWAAWSWPLRSLSAVSACSQRSSGKTSDASALPPGECAMRSPSSPAREPSLRERGEHANPGYPLGEFVGRNVRTSSSPEANGGGGPPGRGPERPGKMVRVSANVRHRDGEWRFLKASSRIDRSRGGRDREQLPRHHGAQAGGGRPADPSEDGIGRSSSATWLVFRTSRDGTFLDRNEAFCP